MAKKKPKLTLRGLIMWLKKKPPLGTYNYTDPKNCLLCQYIKSQGFSKVQASPWAIAVDAINSGVKIPSALNDIAISGKATFGAALNRAEKLASR